MVLPVGRLSPRQGRYARMVYGILVFILYLNMLSIARTWLEKGLAPWELGLWWLHALALVVCAFLVARMLGRRWLHIALPRRLLASLFRPRSW